eukprot:c20658_g1_i3.p1 GENE.c20658_g1_i3~~c20658_g1_i3.p1  ORF type:complete len:817 (-),score=167.69 c20658_g1_i3:146-2596(-)
MKPDAPEEPLQETQGPITESHAVESSSNAPEFRADIDGLRAVAVTSVVVFHAYPSLLPSGFIGVDMFFVISGFLISGIIFRQLATNSFTFAHFYSRRIRRIYPALIIVLLFGMMMACAWLMPLPLKRFADTLLASTLFGANIQLLLFEPGYFDENPELNPLLHLWSLGVEEQFYIVWPVLAMVLHGMSSTRSTVMLGLILAASLLLSIHLSEPGSGGSAGFYLPFTRFWQLGTGSVLALVTLKNPRRLSGPITAFVGLTLVLIGFAVIRQTRPFPSWWASFPTFGCGLLIAAGPDAFVNKRVLSARPLPAIGLISYPLYLWHWPLLVFAQVMFPSAKYRPWWAQPWLMVLVAVLLSVWTYLYVEKKVRYHKSRLVVAGLVAVMALVGVAALEISAHPEHYSRSYRPINVNAGDESWLVSLQSGSASQTATSSPSITASGSPTPPPSPSTTPSPSTSIDPLSLLSPSSSPVSLSPSPSFTSSLTPSPSVTLSSTSSAVPPPSPSRAPASPSPDPRRRLNSSRGPPLESVTDAKVLEAIEQQIFPLPHFDIVPTTHRFYTIAPFVLNQVEDESHPTVVVMGDSHGCAICPRFVNLVNEASKTGARMPSIYFGTRNGMPFFPCTNRNGLSQFEVFMLELARLRPTVVVVVNSFQWIRVTSQSMDTSDLPLRCCPTINPDDACDVPLGHSLAVMKRFSEILAVLVSAGIKVFVGTENPSSIAFKPALMRSALGVSEDFPKSIRLSEFRAANKDMLDRIQQAVSDAGATLLDFADNMCLEDVCNVLDPRGRPIMRDSNHFRPFFAFEYADVLDVAVHAALQ